MQKKSILTLFRYEEKNMMFTEEVEKEKEDDDGLDDILIY